MGVTIRDGNLADESAIVELIGSAMGRDADERYLALHRWKHDENAFGASPRWVAVDDDGTIIGVRLFMRWRFRSSGRTWSAVQAVDTATHPAHQGRGIFRSLTMHAVDRLADDGVDLIFNTPNSKSRPGYLKMGWIDAGQLTPHFWLRPTSALSFLRRRGVASLWTHPSSAGDAAVDALADEPYWLELLASDRPAAGVETERTLDYLRWRYGTPLLAYRVERASSVAVFFRVRDRGPLTEVTVCDVIGSDGPETRRLLRAIRRATGADVLMYIGPSHGFRLLRYPGGGRHLAYRPLATDPALVNPTWALTMGDVEIF